MKVNLAIYDRTAQLINLVSHLDDDNPVDPVWTDFRKQYYPDEESYWEDFNLRFNETEKPLDLYMDLIKGLVETNQKGITGTKQEFATTLGTAPMRKNIRRQHVRNPEVLEHYRRKSKKEGRSTSSSSGDTDDDSDDDSDESLGYRRSFGFQEDKYGRLRTIRRMMEIKNVSLVPALVRKNSREQYRLKHKRKSTSSSSDDTYDDHSYYRRRFGSQKNENDRRMLEVERVWPDARVSELNFKKLPSLEEETTYLRSLYVGEVAERRDDWDKNVEWGSSKKTISWSNQDAWDRPTNNRGKPKILRTKSNEKYTHTIGWEEKNVASVKKTSEKWNELEKKEWDNLGQKKDKKNKGEPRNEAWIKSKETSRDDKPLYTDAWGKNGRDERKMEKDWSKTKHKMHKLDLDDDMTGQKKGKIPNWELLSTTQKRINNYNKPKLVDDGWLEPNKKDIWDSYGNKKIKEYDDNDHKKKKESERAKENYNRESLAKVSWDDYNTPQKNKHDDKTDLRSKSKSNEWHNIGRSIKDSWESKPKKKKDIWDNRSTKGDYDNNLKKKSTWDDKTMKEDSWDEKLKNKDSWDDKPKKKDIWDKKPTKKDIWKDERIKNDNSNSWDDKPAKKDSWDNKRQKKDSWSDEPGKNIKNDKWSDQREKLTTRWREDKTTRDWDPPPTRKKKHDDDDYYERPRSKYAKRDRDMLNVRTPIPFIGKRGIYEDV